MASQPLSIMDSLEVSNPGGSVDFVCPSELFDVSPYKLLGGLVVVCSNGGFVGILLYLCYLFSSANLHFFGKDCLATKGMSHEVLSLPLVIFVS